MTISINIDKLNKLIKEQEQNYEKHIELLKQENEKLRSENEKIKTQYNCYACGNCKGTEDYVNLEKHHKGLRKVYDKLRAENEALKSQLDFEVQKREVIEQYKDIYYKQNLDYELLTEELIQENKKLKDKIKNIAELVDWQADKLEKIEKYISECCHRFSSNNKNLCFGCEYDHEVCDYSKILKIIRGEE